MSHRVRIVAIDREVGTVGSHGRYTSISVADGPMSVESSDNRPGAMPSMVPRLFVDVHTRHMWQTPERTWCGVMVDD